MTAKILSAPASAAQKNVELLTEHGDRLVKRPGILQKRADGSQIQNPENRHRRTHCRCNRIADVTHIIGNRTHDIRKSPRIAGRIAQRFIQLGKMFLYRILVAEDLDYLLPFYHLFNIAVDLSQCSLLLDEKIGRFPADDLD